MIFHLVLLKIKANASSVELDNLFTGIKSLAAVSGVRSVSIETIDNSVYVGYEDRTKGYTHALMVILKDKKSLEAYDKDSHHGTVKSTIIKPMLDFSLNDPVLAVDWEGEFPKLKTCPLTTLTSSSTVTAFTVGVLAAAGFMLLRSRL